MVIIKKILLFVFAISLTYCCAPKKELTIKYEDHIYLKQQLRKHIIDSLFDEYKLKSKLPSYEADSICEEKINMLMDTEDYLNLAHNKTLIRNYFKDHTNY